MTHKQLIETLESAEDGRVDLSIQIALFVGWIYDSEPTQWGELPWLDPERKRVHLPRFSQSLDASLPWENIVETKVHESPDGDPTYWTALQCSPGQPFAGSMIKVFEGRAATEALARRAAALKGIPDA